MTVRLAVDIQNGLFWCAALVVGQPADLRAGRWSFLVSGRPGRNLDLRTYRA
jgi:hypothetical protein